MYKLISDEDASLRGRELSRMMCRTALDGTHLLSANIL